MIPQSKSTQTLCRNNIAGADPGILKKGGGVNHENRRAERSENFLGL